MPSSTTVDEGAPPGAVAAWLAAFGVVACAVWGFAEAVVFFIVPDVMVGAVALFVPRRWWRAAAAAVVGALLGGVVLYAIVTTTDGWARDVIGAVPGVSNVMVEQVDDAVAEHGGAALVRAPLAGIPYKLYVAEMAERSWSIVDLGLWSVPARALRIFPVAVVAALVGWRFRRLIGRFPEWTLAAYVLGWLVVYIVYFAVVVT